MKRQLSIQYENIVNLINDKKKHLRLAQIITYFRFPPKRCADILYDLYADKSDTDKMLDYAIPIITDIYNDNYELEEPKYYWKLNLAGEYGNDIYAFKFLYVSEIGLSSENNLKDAETKFTRKEFNGLISYTQTNLTIDNFTPMEEIE